MNNYKNLFKINEHQIYAEINESSIVVSDLDESTKIIFQEVKNMKMGTFLEWQEYEKNKYVSNTEQNKYFKIHELKQKLSALDDDIKACEDGHVKKKTLIDYRNERKLARNELRVLLNLPLLVDNEESEL